MARVAGANAEVTRSRILDSASEQFASAGLAGVSVRDIARHAGVSLGMVHHYFGSKDELYATCIDSMYAELSAMRAELMLELQDTSSLEQLIADSVRVAFHFARAHQTSLRLLMRNVVEDGGLAPERQSALQLPFLGEMSEQLERQTGRPATELRLSIQSITFLIARYAISSEQELRALSNLAGQSSQSVVTAIEVHLTRAALTLLGFDPELGAGPS